jgi:hypothetical protein
MTGTKPALASPDWLAQPVANYVRLIVTNERTDRHSAEVLQRLSCDPAPPRRTPRRTANDLAVRSPELGATIQRGPGDLALNPEDE